MIGTKWAGIAKINCVWRFSNRVALVCESSVLKIKHVCHVFFFCVDVMCNCIFLCHVDVNNKWPHITSTMQTCIDVASHFKHIFFLQR